MYVYVYVSVYVSAHVLKAPASLAARWAPEDLGDRLRGRMVGLLLLGPGARRQTDPEPTRLRGQVRVPHLLGRFVGRHERGAEVREWPVGAMKWDLLLARVIIVVKVL